MALKKKVKAKPRNGSRRLKAYVPVVGERIPQLFAGEPLKPLAIETMLDVGTQARLAQFCLAHHGADPRVVIHKAVEDFIEHDLSDNVGVSAEYKGAKS